MLSNLFLNSFVIILIICVFADLAVNGTDVSNLQEDQWLIQDTLGTQTLREELQDMDGQREDWVSEVNGSSLTNILLRWSRWRGRRVHVSHLKMASVTQEAAVLLQLQGESRSPHTETLQMPWVPQRVRFPTCKWAPRSHARAHVHGWLGPV